MNPLTIPKYQRASCGCPQFVYYVSTDTGTNRKFEEVEVRCPFCYAVKLEQAINEALIHIRDQCTHEELTPCIARSRTLLEEAIKR